MLGLQFGGGVDIGLEASLAQLGVGLAWTGHVDCNMLNLHCQGEIGLEVDVRYDGTLFSVAVTEMEMNIDSGMKTTGNCFCGIKSTFHNPEQEEADEKSILYSGSGFLLSVYD